MTLVVGVDPEGRGRAALHLAGMLARSGAEEEVLLCAVVPSPWPPSPARVDAEYQAYLERTAADALEHAREALPAVPAASVVHRARSAPAGLLEVAAERGATAIVIGSSTAGVLGRVSLGSVSDRLVHSSDVPLALAPRGYRCKGDLRVARVTAAFGGTQEGDELVVAAAAVAARVGAGLRIASFAVRSRPPGTSGVGTGPERTLVAQWVQEIESASRAALDRVGHLAAAPHELEAVVGYGESWDAALEDVEWQDGDVLVVGSSTHGAIARVFLGSRASKLVRHSPVPVVLVPRGAAAELAHEAERAEA